MLCDFMIFQTAGSGRTKENPPQSGGPFGVRDIEEKMPCFAGDGEPGQTSLSGAWPSWASHLHSVSSMWVNTARKEESSGLQA